MRLRLKIITLFILLVVLVALNISIVKACTTNSGKWGDWKDTSACQTNSCGTNIGTKTQTRTCGESDHGSDCNPGKWVDETWACPKDASAYTSSNDHKDCKMQFGSGSHKYYRYADKVKIAGYWEVEPQVQTRTVSCHNAPVIACPNPTPTIQPEVTPTPTPAVTPEVTPEVTPNPTSEPAPQPCIGCGDWPAAPTCGETKPSTPVLLSVVRKGTTAELTWTEAVPVSHYAIEYGIKPGEFIYGALDVGNTTHYTVGFLDPGTTYYFAVRGVNGCMPSDPSATSPGQVLGASAGGQVLGLASTGNSALLYLYLTGGITFLSLSLFSFRKFSREA